MKHEKVFTHHSSKKSAAGFTLIELLIVIGIIGILAAAVVLFLNPAELLNRARDGRRITDLQSVNDALRLYQVEEGTSFGAASTTYISIPDTSATCANLTLPGLPPGWSYNCKTEADLRKVDGNGWIPVDFTSISGSSPLSKLPVDPVNSDTDSLYYSYVTGGSWVLSAILKSDRELKGIAAGDGGTDDGRYEIGSDLDLWTQASGLVGYWKLDGDARDSSGNGNDGTPTGGPTWTTSCKKKGCLEFDGSNDYVLVADSVELGVVNNFTVSMWLYDQSAANNRQLEKGDAYFILDDQTSNGCTAPGRWQFVVKNSNSVDCVEDPSAHAQNQWYYVTGVKDSSNISIYVDGEFKASNGNASNIDDDNLGLRIGSGDFGPLFNGVVDEVRIYNRVLSAGEIEAIYNATK